LRYFNVYGPRQALSNPYTGIAAIFSGRLLNGHLPVIFEDGRQSRDLTHVSDIVQANLLALEKREMEYGVFNVGTGRALTVLDVAQSLIQHLGSTQTPEIEYRSAPAISDAALPIPAVSGRWAIGLRYAMRTESPNS
jgi:dTDP-L-rhamnose 4-epimerase